jgi:hypothetical protein
MDIDLHGGTLRVIAVIEIATCNGCPVVLTSEGIEHRNLAHGDENLCLLAELSTEGVFRGIKPEDVDAMPKPMRDAIIGSAVGDFISVKIREALAKQNNWG